MTLYRWDDRCLVSFLTVGRLSGEGVQLEVAVRSPLGTFVEQRFDELWQQSKPMDRFTHLPVTLVDATDGRRAFSCRFVYADDAVYVAGHDLVSYMARHRLDQLSAHSDALSAPARTNWSWWTTKASCTPYSSSTSRRSTMRSRRLSSNCGQRRR